MSTPETQSGSTTAHAEEYPRVPLVLGPQNFHRITQTISEIVENPQPKWWWPIFLVSATLMLSAVFSATYLITTGVGVWGSNIPVGWAFDITNFVFWIGIGHAGTLISAILFLFRQKWRTSINRFSEAMTIFAVICAGIYPGIHVGRFWYVWFMFPLPNANHIWPNFRSALLWDLFAVSTYFSVSLMFWYVGLIPDLATLRDRAKTKLRKLIFGFASLGWRGSTRHWRHYEIAYLMLAGLSTPLVLSVHSVVSFDFATSVIPGWHTTIFPPYFVAGAIFGGFAMVLTCMIPVREMYPKLKDLVNEGHMDVMAKFIVATGTLVGYAYLMELFIAWYSGSVYEQQTFFDRAFTGKYVWAYWIMMSCNLIIPQLLWIRWFRVTPMPLFIITVFVNIGMWYERFVIIVQSLAHDYLPGSWGTFYPSWVDWMQMIGDFGLFFTLTLLFIRFLPMIAMAEIKGVLTIANPHHGHADHGTNGHGTNGHGTNGHGTNGHGTNGHGTNGHGSNGHSDHTKEALDAPVPSFGIGEKNHAIMAEFDSPAGILKATKAVYAAGYRDIDAFTPYPVHGMIPAIGKTRSRISLFTLTGGLTGLFTALTMQYFLSAYYYPIMVDGKEYTSWEAFVPICFELTVLFAAICTVLGLFFLCDLPRLFSPKDEHPGFARVTDDGFYLTIDATDPKFDPVETPRLLRELGGHQVAIVKE
ncbi:quinol:electron acceptor oxidoreductase subunit ActD [Tuwongella immobilis]|uniref:Uncharacterized protein n=1 Tax=Tuwongella immobilis TaxID=692036 RepID=A0A6C2YND3_9BACT|nr:quinol:electron acceptor oxidoreductase subunit ActD [Tuwongella immobilis]VIP02791.1 Polysulphide reductase NrfD OS=Chthoniobacter flavus Ellin428 GN=CfE428DRAFT_2219 PE=4 SV=1: NrfD: DUF3341 [Tuwongella immobilis]VTS02461.1 Polysulphide reductase NrfD OS=Chthoniobacter flavus Ellin428 GN=CfE428DRAFT_2219 PE=4 SV=1: NrfD: DUF3341 [Tuwongella immobilis]